MSKGWDNATLKKLKALTGKGLSTAEIGKRLGMSKNAVVGKLNRLGWNSKAGGAPATETVVAQKKKSAPVKSTSSKKASTAKTPVAKVAAPKKTTVAAKSAPKKAAATVKPAAPVKTPKKTATAKPVSAPKADIKPVAAKASATSQTKNLAMHQRIIQHSLEMANLKPNQCRWPIGDPDSEHFHFCGETVFVGKPYCYEHCRQAYQFAPVKKK